MEKKLTAMQELTEHLQSFINTNKGYKSDVTDTVQIILEKAQFLLPKEREQMVEGITVHLDEYAGGYIDKDAQRELATNYFIQKYGE